MMQTDPNAPLSRTGDLRELGLLPTTVAQKVVIVSSSREIMTLVERVLHTGNYDVVVVEPADHAYSRIKSVQPNLIILCVRLDDPNGFQVLSMLKLDAETRGIPVLTYTAEYEGDGEQEDASDDDEASSDIPLFAPRPAASMN